MKHKEIIHQLALRLGTYAEQNRFDFVKSRVALIRKISGGSQIINLALLSYPPMYRIDPNLMIRIDVVEDVYHRVSGIEKQYQQYGHTVGAEFWQFKGSYEDGVYDIYEETDLIRACKGLIRDFDTIALPFFDRYSSIEGVDELLNSTPYEKAQYSAGEAHRCAIGLIVAAKLEKKNYPELVSIYREKLKPRTLKHTDKDLSKLDALIRDLELIYGARP